MIHAPPITPDLKALIQLAMREDLALAGDRTVAVSIPEGMRSTATIVARRPGVISGTFLIAAILEKYQAALEVEILLSDGVTAGANDPVARLTGSTRQILTTERVILNFLGHLSGVATMTRRYVDAVAKAVEDPARRPAVCDTRKTTPGFRMLDKYAVVCGGGVNHRMGLYDGVMLKDNHLAALREKLGYGLTLAELTTQVRRDVPAGVPVWLEVDSLSQLRDALPGGADIVLLDNMTPEQMAEAVAVRNTFDQARPLLEASGGITLETIGAAARSGVDRISIGALTHSAPALDLSMELVQDSPMPRG